MQLLWATEKPPINYCLLINHGSDRNQPHNTLKISQSNELTEAAHYLLLQAKHVLCLVQAYYQREHPGTFMVSVADY